VHGDTKYTWKNHIDKNYQIRYAFFEIRRQAVTQFMMRNDLNIEDRPFIMPACVLNIKLNAFYLNRKK